MLQWRVSLMANMSQTVANNLKRVCIEHDISTRDLAQRMGEKSQKSVWNLLNNEHSPRLSTLEPLCRVLMVSHQAVVTPNIDTSLLVSRRLPRLIGAPVLVNIPA